MFSCHTPSARIAAAVCAVLLSSLSSVAQRAPLTKHVPDMVTGGRARRVETVRAAETLELVVSLPLRNQAEMDGLMADLYNPQSPNYRHWLKPAEFDARFAPTQADYDALVAWARQSGFTIVSEAANRHILTVAATTAVINRALHIELTTYHDAVLNRDFHAPDREPTLDLSVPVLAISGLDTSNPKINHYRKGPAPAPTSYGPGSTMNSGPPKGTVRPNITGSGPSNTYLPSDMRAAYYGSGSLTGTGQTVAVFSFDGYIASDLPLWHTKTSTTSSVPVTNVLTGGFSGGCVLDSPCDDGEQILDIVQVQGMAPGLSGILFYEGVSAVTEINQMITDDKASIITCSWGGGDFGPATEPLFQQLAVQGQTFLNATGDDGAYNGFSYDPPSSSPYIVQVGGTDLTTAGAGGAWASETGWVYSGGGYFDPYIAIPSWQQQARVITSSNAGSATLRNAPDIAAEANFDNSTVVNGSFQTGYGGTSYAAPRMAGYLALANQQSVANGYGTIGFVNPLLYEAGLRSTASSLYHDITATTCVLIWDRPWC